MKLNQTKNNGFTLIEVLVAVTIFSFGLLGVAGLMTISVRNNHNGYLRSQANFLAENMVDRMRANPVALWSGQYDGTAASGGGPCDHASPCTYDALAQYDMGKWADSLSMSLPNGEGEIICDLAVGDGSPINSDSGNWVAVDPYEGVCTVTVSWNERNEEGSEDQSVVLVVQP